MQPAIAPAEKVKDLGFSVLSTMRQLGVMSLPRNYEIFYEALAGTNTELTLEVVALNQRPSQADLDRIGRKYFAHNHSHAIVETVRETLARELEDVAKLLRSERAHIEKYGEVLSETSEGLENRSAMSRDLLQRIIGVMSVATTSTLDHGLHVATTLSEKSAELESVKSALEEYKLLADTDPLTQICNRRAFDKRISGLYDSERGIMFGALILADIDRFKDVNDRFGHPVGDKIIQIVAGILRNNVHSEVFVARTGGEEFAVILEGATEQANFELADELRGLIERTPFVTPGGSRYGPVTVSMGVCMASDADSPDDLYAKADRALYRSKIGGRNAVTKYSTIRDHPLKGWMLYKRD